MHDIHTDDAKLRATIHDVLKKALIPSFQLLPGDSHCHCRYSLSATKLNTPIKTGSLSFLISLSLASVPVRLET